MTILSGQPKEGIEFKVNTISGFVIDSITSEPVMDVNIDIYNLNGGKIKTISQYLEISNNHFYRVYWDGLDNHSKKISNGIYLYELEILENDISLHKKIYKIAKSK